MFNKSLSRLKIFRMIWNQTEVRLTFPQLIIFNFRLNNFKHMENNQVQKNVSAVCNFPEDISAYRMADMNKKNVRMKKIIE